MANWEIVAGALFFGPGLSSMLSHANSIRTTKAKRIPKQKVEERPTTSNDFSLINLVLCAGLNIPICTSHCILLIGITCNENPCKWTPITISEIYDIMQYDIIFHEANNFPQKVKYAQEL